MSSDLKQTLMCLEDQISDLNDLVSEDGWSGEAVGDLRSISKGFKQLADEVEKEEYDESA